MQKDVGKRLIEMASGETVESDVLNIAIKIREYDPNLRLKYLPPESSSMSDAPYALFELCPDGHERMVFTAWTLDDRILDRIKFADTGKNDVMARLEANNAKVRAANEQRYRDRIAEKHDIFKHAFKHPGQTYSFVSDDGETLKTIDEDARGGLRVEPRRTKGACPNATRG